MPLICEVKDIASDTWVEVQQLIPGDPPKSILHWNAFGGRELYLLICEPDDSQSTLFKSAGGPGVRLPASVREISPEDYEIIEEIKDGQGYERRFFTDTSLVPNELRFRHVAIDFGLRKCLICNQEFPTTTIGQHSFSHGVDELRKWPGGLRGLMKYYRQSVRASIAKAEGFPRVQERLREALAGIETAQRGINKRSI